jgi:hypothetical protein
MQGNVSTASSTALAGKPTARMKGFERYLFPRNPLVEFLIIACLSGAISYFLMGRQIFRANWGLIDDHVVFYFLGPHLDLSFSDIWNTLLTKTEVGTLQGRFRPGYYLFTLIETWLWGANVHLWYLARTIGFAVFLSSIWWFMRRFIGIWLSGALTLYISLLPLWADIWSRLGPSEIYGAVCIGIMAFAAYCIFFSDAARTRNAGAITLTLATIALVGMKETFIPIAGATAALFLLAGIRKNLSPLLIGILAFAVFVPFCGIAIIVRQQVAATGTDYYANAIGIWPVLRFFGMGLLAAIGRTWWVILFFAVLYYATPRKPFKSWSTATCITLGAYGFLVVTYAAQGALYRSGFPLHSRYDFPALLLSPLSFCLLACYVFYSTRTSFSERATNYVPFAMAAALLLYCAVGSGNGKALSAAVRANIEITNSFYNELQRAVRAAAALPESPVILEAYGPGAYEAVFSLSYYMPSLGVRNPISVRLHPEDKTDGKLYDGLQQTLAGLEQAGGGTFTPLQRSLAGHPQNCVSIGINGSPDAGCSGFRVYTR